MMIEKKKDSEQDNTFKILRNHYDSRKRIRTRKSKESRRNKLLKT